MAPDGACEVAQNTARSNAKSEAERVERPLASPDDHRELVITCGSCFTNAGGRFSGLPGLLQVALDGSWWHHVLPDCLRYFQMFPDEHMELLSGEVVLQAWVFASLISVLPGS